MKVDEIRNVLISIVVEYLESQDMKIDVDNDTVLFGDGAILDSMGLVNIVIDVESAFLDKGYEISLTSETAMSRRQSPFRNISTLSEFIGEQL